MEAAGDMQAGSRLLSLPEVLQRKVLSYLAVYPPT
jgi:predicted DNA-binding transcriptional regulator AlpA